MDVVVVGTGPEGKDVVQAPGKFVTAVGVDGLEQAADDPEIHGQDVKISGEGAK